MYNVTVNLKYSVLIAPDFWYLDTKNSGIEAWCEINVGPYKQAWHNIGERVMGFSDAEDAVAFKLVFG